MLALGRQAVAPPGGLPVGRRAAPAGAVPVGAGLMVDHLRPVRSGYVTAIASPVHQDRRTCVYEVRVSDDEGRAVARGTLRSLYTWPDARPSARSGDDAA